MASPNPSGTSPNPSGDPPRSRGAGFSPSRPFVLQCVALHGVVRSIQWVNSTSLMHSRSAIPTVLVSRDAQAIVGPTLQVVELGVFVACSPPDEVSAGWDSSASHTITPTYLAYIPVVRVKHPNPAHGSSPFRSYGGCRESPGPGTGGDSSGHHQRLSVSGATDRHAPRLWSGCAGSR